MLLDQNLSTVSYKTILSVLSHFLSQKKNNEPFSRTLWHDFGLIFFFFNLAFRKYSTLPFYVLKSKKVFFCQELRIATQTKISFSLTNLKREKTSLSRPLNINIIEVFRYSFINFNDVMFSPTYLFYF